MGPILSSVLNLRIRLKFRGDGDTMAKTGAQLHCNGFAKKCAESGKPSQTLPLVAHLPLKSLTEHSEQLLVSNNAFEERVAKLLQAHIVDIIVLI